MDKVHVINGRQASIFPLVGVIAFGHEDDLRIWPIRYPCLWPPPFLSSFPPRLRFYVPGYVANVLHGPTC